MLTIRGNMPVGQIVGERLGRAEVFDRLGIDYCCHGHTSLEEACQQRAIDVEHAVALIEAADEYDQAVHPIELTSLSPGELADHIVETHHVYLREEMPKLLELAAKVVAAHRERHPELVEVQQTLQELHTELESHLMKEERILFPLIKQLETATRAFPMHCGSVNNPIRVMEHEHDSAGTALERLRSLTQGYVAPDDACMSFRLLYNGLERLEVDLHHHIHKENNLLFPRAALLEQALKGS